MKKTFVFLSVAVVMGALSGCGLFSRGDEDEVSATEYRLSWQQEQLQQDWNDAHCDQPDHAEYSASNCNAIRSEMSTAASQYQQCKQANAGLDREKGLSPARAAAVRTTFSSDLHACIGS